MTPVAELHAGADATLGERHEAVVLACPDAAARARLAALLAEEDLLVVSCGTAAEAERQLAGARPDLLVLWAPSEEPEVLRLLERLREDADGRRVPALVLAADAPTRLRAFSAGRTTWRTRA